MPEYIVATDGSPESERAIEYATEHALAFDATVRLTHVATPTRRTVDGADVFEGEDEAMNTGERVLAEGADRVRAAAEERGGEVPVETELLSGRPAHAIAELAESVGADAVYVGHRGLSSEHEKMVGSVAKGVLDEASVPVTVVR